MRPPRLPNPIRRSVPLKTTGNSAGILKKFQRFDRPLLAAISRKTFIGTLLNQHPEERLTGSLAVTMMLLLKGASVVRTHDVRETRDVIRVFERMVKGA